MKAFLLVVLATATLSAQSERNYTLQMDGLKFLLNRAMEKSGVQILSQDVHQVMVDGRTKSMFADVSLSCKDSTTVSVQVVTNTAPALTGKVLADMEARRMRPIERVDEWSPFLNSLSLEKQKEYAIFFLRYLLGACLAKGNPEFESIGYHLAVTVFSSDSGDGNLVIQRVSPRIYESLKK